MASQTVEAVEFQMEGKIRLPEEAFQPVRPHVADIHEEHVSPDEGQDRLRLLPGEAEPLEDRGRDLFPPPDMSVEMDSGFIFKTGDRLAHVMEEDRPGETQVRTSIPSGEKGEHPQGMFPDIPLGMEDRRLVDSPEGQNLGKDLGKKAAFRQELHPVSRPAARQYPVELLPDALGADPPDGRRLPSDGGQGLRVERKSERGGKADRPEHPQMILGETLIRVADRPDEAAFDIATAVDVIDDPARLRIHEQTVDRKVPATDILLGGGEDDSRGVASVFITGFHPEGGHLVRASPLDDENDAETGADGNRPGKKRPDLFRPGRGDDVEILRRHAADEIADAAAHQKGLVAGLPQAADDGGGIIQRHAHLPELFPAATLCGGQCGAPM